MRNQTSVDRFRQLIKDIDRSGETPSSKKEVFEIVEYNAKAIPEYFNQVINYGITVPMLYTQISYDEDAKDRIQEIDAMRRSKHMMLASAVNVLNRVSNFYSKQPIFELDHELDPNNANDRSIAANVAYDFCETMFCDQMAQSGCYIQRHVEPYKIDSELSQRTEDRRPFPTSGITVDKIRSARELPLGGKFEHADESAENANEESVPRP